MRLLFSQRDPCVSLDSACCVRCRVNAMTVAKVLQATGYVEKTGIPKLPAHTRAFRVGAVRWEALSCTRNRGFVNKMGTNDCSWTNAMLKSLFPDG